MNILNYATFQVDVQSNSTENITLQVQETDFEDYLSELISEVSQNRNSRNFEFVRDTTEIKALIDTLFEDGNFASFVQGASQRLLASEVEAQAGIAHLGNEIQKGLLIIARVEENGLQSMFICKAEHVDFLEETNYTITKGLPIKKKLFKAFLASFDSNNQPTSVLVFDTNQVMAKYWWHDYLELSPVRTNSKNTELAFQSLERRIFAPLKKKHPADYMNLRNSTVHYFRSNEDFSIDDYLEKIIEPYPPVDEELKINDLKTKIEGFPEKYKFDNRFTIDKAEVKARQSNKVSLNDNLELVMKSDIDLPNIIKAYMEDDGQKYIRIRTDNGYDTFIQRQEQQ